MKLVSDCIAGCDRLRADWQAAAARTLDGLPRPGRQADPDGVLRSVCGQCLSGGSADCLPLRTRRLLSVCWLRGPDTPGCLAQHAWQLKLHGAVE